MLFILYLVTKDTQMLQKYIHELNQLQNADNLRTLTQGPIGGALLNLSSNDYLGLAGDLQLRAAFLAKLTPQNFVPSASSSRLLTGNFPVHDQLEALLSELYGQRGALAFTSGYHMNIGILPALCDKNTLVLADKLVHASLIDGILLARVKFIRYRHNDYVHLENLLHDHAANYARVIIVTESIFSMDGDAANLQKLVALKRAHGNVMLYVDEAHALGVRGLNGLGLSEELHCLNDIDLLAGTFGKALASVGAFVICAEPIRTYLINKMRPLIFTTALPPVNLMWTQFVLERLSALRTRREHLANIARLLRAQLAAKGHISPSTSHIIPVILGESRAAVAKARMLQTAGFYLLPIRPPSVPPRSARIRISLTADVGEKDVERLAECL